MGTDFHLKINDISFQVHMPNEQQSLSVEGLPPLL